MHKFLLTDSNGKKSLTATLFVSGFVVVNLKLLLAGLTVGSFAMAAFTGMEYAAAVAALGAIYNLRRHKNMKEGGKAK